MATNANETHGPGEIQVFELTMDNDEDQDELNRLLRKPGEPGYCPPAKKAKAAQSPPDGGKRESGAELPKNE